MSQSYFISYRKSDPGQPFSLEIQFLLRYRASEVKLKRALKRRKKIKRWAVGRRSRAEAGVRVKQGGVPGRVSQSLDYTRAGALRHAHRDRDFARFVTG